MKKVLAIAPYPYLPFFSGGQKFIARFYESLAAHTELTVISTRSNDASLAKGYRLLPLLKQSFSRYYDTGLIRMITDEIRQGNYDAIIWEHPYYAWLARKLKKNTGIKTILHTHNIEHQRFRSTGKWWWPILRRYEKKFFREADHILFISPGDRDFAVKKWNIPPVKCIDVPFGIDNISHPADREEKQDQVKKKYSIAADEHILLFNGLLNYKPNLDALKAILDEINPILLTDSSFRYRIVICGKGLPEELRGLESYKDKNIIFAGFVDDISAYFKAADILLNPVLSGGGVKTKMVEAIGFGTTAVAMRAGATGIRTDLCGEKLVIVDDHDWKKFAASVIEEAGKIKETPREYYEYYNWNRIISKLVQVF